IRVACCPSCTRDRASSMRRCLPDARTTTGSSTSPATPPCPSAACWACASTRHSTTRCAAKSSRIKKDVHHRDTEIHREHREKLCALRLTLCLCGEQFYARKSSIIG